MRDTIYLIPDRPANEAERQLAVFRSRALTMTDRQQFTPILETARRELRVGAAGITIIYEDWAYLIAASGFNTGVYRRSTSLCAHTILSPDQITILPDTKLDDRFAGNPFVDDKDGVRFYAGAPLLGEHNLPLGAVCVFDGEPRTGLTGDEHDCLQLLARAASATVQQLTRTVLATVIAEQVSSTDPVPGQASPASGDKHRA